MYKNFSLTESEKEQILNMHQTHGYKKPVNEYERSHDGYSVVRGYDQDNQEDLNFEGDDVIETVMHEDDLPIRVRLNDIKIIRREGEKVYAIYKSLFGEPQKVIISLANNYR